jgi:ATP-dependent exoDNAse (exonuclease V) beta subunit
LNGNLLIEASAGTGKTQALGMRLIELLRQGLKPQEIVALTFSRAAAGEIFERFVTLLAGFAEKNPADVSPRI